MTTDGMAGAFLAAKLRACDDAIGAAVPRVLAMEDAEAIHDLRVAIRRARTLLKASRDIFGRWRADLVRRAYADVQRATGALRDAEVLDETLASAGPPAGMERWLDQLRVRERRLRAVVVGRLKRGDLERAHQLARALVAFPVKPTRDVEARRFAKRTVARAARRVDAGLDTPLEDVAGLHALRIAYKELRYAVDLMEDVLGEGHRARLESAITFQKRLGEIHDVDVAIAVIGRARLAPTTQVEMLGELQRAREKALGKYQRDLRALARSSDT